MPRIVDGEDDRGDEMHPPKSAEGWLLKTQAKPNKHEAELVSWQVVAHPSPQNSDFGQRDSFETRGGWTATSMVQKKGKFFLVQI